MKLLILNPNTSPGVTQRIVAAARGVAAPTTEIVGVTGSRGVPYIATRAEAIIGGALVLEILAERADDFDAVVIAAFGDPGLAGARELMTIPVVGMAEAAMLTACMLGRRFAIVTFSQTLEPWYRECVEYNGLDDRFAGFAIANGGFASIDDVQIEMEARLIDLAHRAVTDHGADVVIFGGAPLAGLAERVRDRVPVPVIDAAEAAVKQAEALVALRPRKAAVGPFRCPDPKPSAGLAPALHALISGSRGN
ncbi:MAG: aspartate/glutamate racemase family protein [Stellaceae bacterium]